MTAPRALILPTSKPWMGFLKSEHPENTVSRTSTDMLCARLRLACVQTIFLDFEYAVAENTEQSLWSLHTSINTEYRRCLGRLKNSPNAVERRKVEKMYNNYLRIAQKFYKGYIQRLAARYDVRELKRVAQGIEVEQITTEDTISPVPQELSIKVLNSCHATLIRMGDLARYRIQARHKKSGYETALTYYSLAQDLMPDSGFAYHQMGIVNLDEGNHLDVVYHLYRAWAVAKPHPNAKSNLEAKFKALQTMSASSSRHSPSTPQDVFVMWFVKLHALFYKGEVFSQHEELEGEVIHRLEMTAKEPTAGSMLLKMVLINISAHDIAYSKFTGLCSVPTIGPGLTVSETHKPNAGRFYQYISRLNTRFILTLCAVLEKKLKEAEALDADGTSGDKPSPGPMPVVEALLPPLRIYSMWLAARRQEVLTRENTSHPGSMTTMMIRSLARVVTLLCLETYKQENPASCPYLLAEDLEIRGLRPLAEDAVPEPCRSYCGDDGLLKPHPPSADPSLDPARQRIARILDILRCAYFMAEDEAVPMAYRVVDTGLVFEYQAEVPAQQAPAAKVAAATNGVANDKRAEQAPRPVETAANNGPPQGPQARPTNTQEPRPDYNEPVDRQDFQSIDPDEAAEDTVFNMLAPFLKPPTPQQQTRPGALSATPNYFPSMQPEPSPTGSVHVGKFEPLPWNWVYTPTPRTAEEPSSSAGARRFPEQFSPNQSSKGSNVEGLIIEDPFHSPSQPFAQVRAPQIQGNLGHPSPSSAADDAHRHQLLQSFVNGGAPRTSVFSNWSQSPITPRQPSGAASSSWRQPALDHLPSSGSAFSHPSSLYQGTPANGVGVHMPAQNQMAYPPHLAQREDQGRQFRVDQTTSSYDAAILNSAYYSGR